MRIAGNKDGKVVAFIADVYGTGGFSGGADVIAPYVYSIPNSSRAHSEVFLNAGSARAMRAPGHPQGCIMMEGTGCDANQGSVTHPPPLPGFQVTICCRTKAPKLHIKQDGPRPGQIVERRHRGPRDDLAAQ